MSPVAKRPLRHSPLALKRCVGGSKVYLPRRSLRYVPSDLECDLQPITDSAPISLRARWSCHWETFTVHDLRGPDRRSSMTWLIATDRKDSLAHEDRRSSPRGLAYKPNTPTSAATECRKWLTGSDPWAAGETRPSRIIPESYGRLCGGSESGLTAVLDM